jgi:predicted anti-sigma-YlaC factor YlaD
MRLFVALLAIVATLGCSVKKYAINKLGDSLANSGTTFSSDDDPEFVGGALPFSLKLIESLLAESPKHRGLLTAAASGFTQYAYVYVQQDAEELEDQDTVRASHLNGRARKLYLRARAYGLRGLEVKHPGFEKKLRQDAPAAVSSVTKADVPLLFWTASAWGAAISLSKDNPDLIAEQPLVEALIDRALALDESFDSGAIHGFLISYEPSRPGGEADAPARCRAHFDRVMQLSKGQSAAPLVSLAEAVSVSKQNKKEFMDLLDRALKVDPDARPELRLSNLVMQRRARWLQGRVDKLFVE